MAIIYSYPLMIDTISGDDLLLMTDVSDSKKTKSIKVSALPSSGVGITLTTTGTSGPATLIGTVLNVPQYSGSSYQAGNGIDIDTSTNPDTLKTGLAANGGLVFDTAKMKVDLAATAMSGELRPVDGGTGLNTYTAGDLLYAETTETLGPINVGTNDKILGVNNGGTAPEWITNLVGKEVTQGYMLIGANTAAMTPLNTTAKGTIVVGNGSTTTTKTLGTDTHVLTAKSADATGVSWEAITFPTVNLASGVTGTLPVGNGGTGLASFSSDGIVRGNGTNALIADSYITYGANAKSLKIRGTGNTAPSLSCTLNIDDAQGVSTPIDKQACIGLKPTGSQGARGMYIELGGYNRGVEMIRTNVYASTAMIFTRLDSLVGGGTGASTVGSITIDNTSTTYSTSSDYRLKENVVDMTGAVDRVKQLKPNRFNFIGDSKTVDGFLAHEAQAVVPESVTGTKDEVDADGNAIYQGIDQAKLVPLLVGAIKELTARIEALEA